MLVVISGPSGVGKTTVVERLAQVHPFHLSVSLTTRDARPGEVDGEDYEFVSDDDFQQRVDNGDFLEWAHYSDRRYGTLRGSIEERLASGSDVVLEIEVQGAGQVKAAMPESLMIFVVPPSLAELEERLRGRGDTHDFERRLEIARTEMEVGSALADHVVINDDLERVVSEVAGILKQSKGPLQ